MSIRSVALLVCDIQTHTIKNLYNHSTIIKNINFLLEARKNLPAFKLALGYQLEPQKLGELSPKLKLDHFDSIFNKSNYSMVDTQMIELFDKKQINEVIITGMETQWCIAQTVRDLLKIRPNYKLNIPVDAVGNSRSINDNIIIIDRLRQYGAWPTLTNDIIAEYLDNFNDSASKWYIRYLKKIKEESIHK